MPFPVWLLTSYLKALTLRIIVFFSHISRPRTSRRSCACISQRFYLFVSTYKRFYLSEQIFLWLTFLSYAHERNHNRRGGKTQIEVSSRHDTDRHSDVSRPPEWR